MDFWLLALATTIGPLVSNGGKDVDASPYINHPISVARLVADIGEVTDLVTLLGAVLHDTIEDTKTTSEELEQHFGRDVRRVVEEVTDDQTLEQGRDKLAR